MLRRALIGKGGHSRELLTLINYPLETFTDQEFLDLKKDNYEVMIAVGDPKVRKQIIDKLSDRVKFFSYIHPTAIIGRDVEIGPGSYVGPLCVLTTNIKIGSHALLLRSNHVGHDTVVGDYLSLMGGAIISGNCTIGDRFFMGNNASVKEKISICNDVVLGMNGCIIRDIKNPGTYVGVPCKQVNL